MRDRTLDDRGRAAAGEKIRSVASRSEPTEAGRPPTGAPDDLDPLANAVWWALRTEQRELAEVAGRARRYPADVSVFAGVDVLDAGGWADLATLVGPSGTAALFRAEIPPPPAGWTEHHRGRGRQMTVTADALAATADALADDRADGLADELAATPTSRTHPTVALEMVRRLTMVDIGEVLALVEVARPGPFAERTLEMGRYWGHLDEHDRLLAMAGERMHLEGHTEISAVCTHPDARGQGLATALTRRVAQAILDRGEVPFLHVAEGNDRARAVYRRLGFTERRTVEFAVLEAPAGGA